MVRLSRTFSCGAIRPTMFKGPVGEPGGRIVEVFGVGPLDVDADDPLGAGQPGQEPGEQVALAVAGAGQVEHQPAAGPRHGFDQRAAVAAGADDHGEQCGPPLTERLGQHGGKLCGQREPPTVSSPSPT